MVPHARFDDLTPGAARSFELVDPRGVAAATEDADVPEALARVEQATEDGLWAAGFVCYEAAPAFDTALRVHRPGAMMNSRWPLVWFGRFEDRRLVPPPER